MKPTILIFSNKEALSRKAAGFFVQKANEAVTAHGRFLTALSGGSTPQLLYRLLSQRPYREQMPWEKTFVFWGDERLVPPADPGSSYGMANDLLLKQVPIPSENIFRALGEAASATAVADYTSKLAQFAERQSWPRFDLILLGMGSDGHTASLFPGPIPAEEERDPVIAVTAHYDGRPARRLTFTPMVFNDAHHILFMAAGKKKAEALAAVLQGELNYEKWPAQRIRPRNGTVTWLVDEAAAAKLT